MDYRATMTLEGINDTPEKWMEFYPHEQYESFLRALMNLVDGEKAPTIWLYGNYGTGKSSAALVTQKLYIDDESRVSEWFSRHGLDQRDRDMLPRLLEQRKSVLFIYDYNAGNIQDANDTFIIRLEKTIANNLERNGMKIPSFSNDIDRLMEQLDLFGEERFFEKVEEMKNKLILLPEFVNLDSVKKAITNLESTENPLAEVEVVLKSVGIYSDLNVDTFKEWIGHICQENGLTRIVYAFDEFSSFIDNFNSNLKTFEQISEAPDISGFIFIPITHTNIPAFYSEKAKSASKSKDRFQPFNLTMPNDVAFRLVASAIRVTDDVNLAMEWKNHKLQYWNDVSEIADEIGRENNFDPIALREIFPIHPVTGLLLKILSESVKSNQRSIFGFMKDRSNAKEFQQFLTSHGPTSDSPFLTPDYLWNYFIEAPNDIGSKDDVVDIKNYYHSQVDRNHMIESDETRVFKTILIFELITRLGGGVNKFFTPSIKNVDRSYRASGLDPEPVIKELEKKGCITITNDEGISILSQVVDREKIQKEIKIGMEKFNETLRPHVSDFARKHVEKAGVSTSERFEFYSSSVSKTALSNFSKDKYNLKHGTICIWSVFAENLTESESSSEHIKKILEQLKGDFRIILLDMSKTTFCLTNAKRWESFVECQVRSNTQDRSVRESMQSIMNGYLAEWQSELEKSSILFYYYNPTDDRVVTQSIGFDRLGDCLTDFIRMSMPNCPDILTTNSNMLKKVRKDVVKLGFTPDAKPNKDFSPFYNDIKKKIEWSPDWFEKNPDHPISVIHKEIMEDLLHSFTAKRDYSLLNTVNRLRGGSFGLLPNNVSGFVLGFCLKELLDDGLILNTGKMTMDLGEMELSELIADALSDNSAGAEYKIRSLSDEDLSFIQNVSKMFKIQQSDNRNIKSVVNNITERYNTISGKVPIWVIPEYAKYNNDEKTESIKQLISDLAIICKTSSKGNPEEYSDAIKNAGTLFMNDPELAEVCSRYIDGGILRKALTDYLDNNYPSLNEVAEKLGISPTQYTLAVLDKMSASAGSLWEERNLAVNVDEVIAEFKIVSVFKEMMGGGPITYDDAIKSLIRKIKIENKLPRNLILDVRPALREFLDSLDNLDRQHDNATLARIYDVSVQNCDSIRNLFFDHEEKETLSIIRNRSGDLFGLDDNEIKGVYSKFDSYYMRTESEFFDAFKNECGRLAETLNCNRVKRLWKEKVPSDSPRDWAMENKMPSRFSMTGLDPKDAVDVMDCFYDPNRLTSSVMETLLTKLESWTYDYSRSKDAFMKWCIPERYAGLEIQFSSIVEYLGRIDADPDKWNEESLYGLIHDKYRTDFVPETKAKISKMDAEQLKQILLRHLDNNPDLGLLFWER